MKVEEIVFEDTKEDKKRAAQSVLGRQVVLKDEHRKWCHGVVSDGVGTFDNDTYMIQTSDGRGRVLLHYHDLQQLLRIS
ncbi:MAG: hypothetical protein Q8N88_07075 [Nanoarchaeota archaeon]|nr:hypothetical protein [Nanoarchaeota archaeon]